MAETSLLACIDAVCAAGLDPELWPEALGQVSKITGSVGALLIPVFPAAAIPFVVSERLEAANRDYASGWAHHDSRVHASHRLALRPGLLITDGALFTPEEIARDPFYQDFLRRHGLGLGAYRLIPDGTGALASISLMRGFGCGAFEAAELLRVEQVSGHLARALHVNARFAEARCLAGDLEEAIEHLGTGLILLDGRGRARFVNAPARRLLGDGLSVDRDGCLAARLPAERPRLAGLLAAAASGQPSGPLLLARPQGAPLHLDALPTRGRGATADALSAAAGTRDGIMLLVRDTARATPAGTVDQLRQLGLTLAEARIADLIGQGQAPAEAADAFAISIATVRTHLKAINAKLGLSRQGELVALVMRLSAWTRADRP
ncbi:hypothetical protein FF100_26975 [Methylobacterium terricola]|uniref:HTH luxR-type domain-containing protein n=1 Tax=Methylobacterium terricola TaxID=2583531 RepID=A0A5C4LAD3_9HYPH|nr:hypothetical protein [Methylobacterium terricola]TNC09213.1 hypothetical protein FF100_26975 [Methylobacterium terricola]